MLRFLQHIRIKIMEQNKVRTYFLYAIGEIVLVVIGILIALQINTWNQENQNKNQEQLLLKQLQEATWH